MPSAQEWNSLFKELKGIHELRNRDYFRLHNIYHGNFYDGIRPDVHDGAGRLILKDTRRSNEERKPLVANLLKGIVDDYVSLVGSMPNIKVPAPGTDDSAQQFADRITKYHYGIWYDSRMLMQLKAMGWWNSVMGGCAAIVWPNFIKRHATIRFVAPYMFYGVPDLVEPYALSKAIIAEKFDYLSVKDYYPNVDLSRVMDEAQSKYYYSYQGQKRRVEVVKCFDKNEVVTIINGQEVARAYHGLGWCPVTAIQNILIPGELRGHSDIEQAVGLNEHVNFIMNAYEEYVLQDIYAPLVVVDPQKAPEDINVLSPNEVIAVNAGGSVSRLPAGHGSATVQQEIERAKGLIEHNTGDPKVRLEGKMASSITTGRGIEKAQAPHFNRVEYRHDILGFYLERINDMHVKMTYAMFPDDKISLFGTSGKQGAAFRLQMQGKELEDYGWTQVTYSPSMHMGLSERAVFVLQLLSAEHPLIDPRSAVEFLGISDAPDEMLKRIDDFLDKNLQRQIAMQKAMAAPPQGAPAALPSAVTGGGPGGQAGAPAALPGAVGNEGVTEHTSMRAKEGPSGDSSIAMLSSGTTTKGQSALDQIDMSNPPEAPAKPVDVGLGQGIIPQIISLLTGVKLTGDVYAVGNGPNLTILTTNFVDARRIKRKIQRMFPRVTVRAAGKKMPPNATQIAGPSEGSEESGTPEEQQSPGAAPEF